MGHGTPDWWPMSIKQTVYALSDMAELAVRLGSIVSFDRRGDVMLLDDFEDGINKSYPSGLGPEGTYTQDDDRPKNGKYSCKLIAGLGAPLAVGLKYKLSYPNLSSFGFEVSWLILNEFDYMTFDVILYDGSYNHYGYVWYDRANKIWEYQDANGDSQTIVADWDLLLVSPPYHTLKLVVDMENDQYRRLIIDDNTYLVAGEGIKVTEDDTKAHIACHVVLHGRSGEEDYVNIDDVIITQNEP